MRTKLFAGAAIAALMMPAAAFAQSTGSIDFDEGSEIVVTGAHADKGIGGVQIPDSPKAKVVLNQEIIARQRPGQTVNEIINLVPGVSFTNNDPWGSLGGNFTIRGFDSSRISQTFDGIPLNDSGNYAIYTNQQIDPELISNVNVNLGSTDVDSPTASAVGGTVNINTLTPTDEIGALVSASYGNIIAPGSGDRPYYRVFGMVNTGDITGHGTKAWFSASHAYNKAAFANYGKVDKQQYNAKIYQEIGTNGDFVSISGNYNKNRNNFGGSPLSFSNVILNNGDIILKKSGRFYNLSGSSSSPQAVYPCNTTTPTPGVADGANGCGTNFERRYNPSNTGNVIVGSRFTMADGLILSVDGSYQYVKANGGGTVNAREAFNTASGTNLTGFFGGTPYFGRDLNGDGDLLDTVTVLAPSQTMTNRWTAIVNLAYEINDTNRVRLSYTFDHARHRQTGEVGGIAVNGEPFTVFPWDEPLTDTAGNVLEKRNRKSFAILHQVAGEYSGSFLADALNVKIGARVPFYERKLNQFCFSTSLTGFVDCIAGGNSAAYAAANPYSSNAAGTPSGAAPPLSRNYDYNKFLPNLGATYHFTQALSFAVSYAANLSVPGTDTLYNSVYIPASNPAAKPKAETSDSFDVSLRYETPIIQAAVTGWYSKYKNRIVSAFSEECSCSIDTNLGAVKKYGVDASISVRPMPKLLAYVFGSYIGSEIEQNVAAGLAACPTTGLSVGACFVDNGAAFYETSGKRERAAPEYLVGGRLQGTIGPVDLGAQIKRTGASYLNDINTVKVPGYTIVDLDVRYSLAGMGLQKSYLQLNVSNLFDQFYVGSFSGGLITPSSNFVNFGSPRAISGSLIVAF